MSDARDDAMDSAHISELYQATRGALNPPDWLDERILTAAQRAAALKTALEAPSSRRRRGARFWAAPVALAATLALAVGLVQIMRTHEPLAPLEEMKTSSSLAKPLIEREIAPQTTPLSNQAESRAADQTSPRAMPPAPAKSVAPVAAGAAPAPPPVPAAPPARPAATSELGRAQPAPVERRKQESFRSMSPPRQEEDRPDQDEALQQKIQRSPTEWLAEIARLRQQGRMVEADASLAEFRRQYPDYPVDKTLEPPQ